MRHTTEQWGSLKTMARQRKAEDETTEQAEIRRLCEKVANTANRSDKVSWNRKLELYLTLPIFISVSHPGIFSKSLRFAITSKTFPTGL